MADVAPPFWLVWREGGGFPMVKHPSEHEAEAEARRLAKKNPGQSFLVLCPALRITHTHTIVERFDATDDGIPF